MRASTVDTLLLLAALAVGGLILFSAASGESVGAAVGSGIGDQVDDAIAAAADSVWNGTGNGPLDSWSNLANFLTGNCQNGDCSGS